MRTVWTPPTQIAAREYGIATNVRRASQRASSVRVVERVVPRDIARDAGVETTLKRSLVHVADLDFRAIDFATSRRRRIVSASSHASRHVLRARADRFRWTHGNAWRRCGVSNIPERRAARDGRRIVVVRAIPAQTFGGRRSLASLRGRACFDRSTRTILPRWVPECESPEGRSTSTRRDRSTSPCPRRSPCAFAPCVSCVAIAPHFASATTTSYPRPCRR